MGRLMRLIGKCLHVGVLEGVELSTSETGTVQGSVLSPLLGNVYLHYALDRWFERRVKPRLRGQATLVRYADDFVIGFEYQGGCTARDGRPWQAARALRTDPASRQDAPIALPASAEGAGRAGKVGRPSTSLGSRSTGRGPARDVGECSARHAMRA